MRKRFHLVPFYIRLENPKGKVWKEKRKAELASKEMMEVREGEGTRKRCLKADGGAIHRARLFIPGSSLPM